MSVDYTSVPLVKAQLGIEDGDNDGLIQAAVSAASRAIDRYTSTTFYPVTEARHFYGRPDGSVWVDPITDPTDLLVETGSLGSYDTAIAETDVVLWPPDAPSRGQAYVRIWTPYFFCPPHRLRGHPNVRVTATWGYSSVPADVAEAALIKAVHLYRRNDSPDGFTGTFEDTFARISRFEDPDVHLLLLPFQPSWLR